MHQRVVGLRVLDHDIDTNHLASKRTVMLQGPPSPNIAPPGKYMLFLLHGDTYGPAKWVTVASSSTKKY